MDPDPVCPERLDPDPDPVNIGPDPQPCAQLTWPSLHLQQLTNICCVSLSPIILLSHIYFDCLIFLQIDRLLSSPLSVNKAEEKLEHSFQERNGSLTTVVDT